MKLISDYHNHPLGHDSDRVYSFELLTEWLSSAKKRGLKDIALTDHDRYKSGTDLDIFKFFKETLPENINFRLGIELDNDPESSKDGFKWAEKNYDKLDFILGSVHFVGNWAFDHPNFKKEFDDWNINELYKIYFGEMQKLIKLNIADALSHFDLIKVFGHRPSKGEGNLEEIDELIKETLVMAKNAGLALEISTAGWHKPVNEIYPKVEIIQVAKELGIPFTTASDAHSPSHLGRDFDKLGLLLEQLGIREVVVFEKHKKKTLKLEN